MNMRLNASILLLLPMFAIASQQVVVEEGNSDSVPPSPEPNSSLRGGHPNLTHHYVVGKAVKGKSIFGDPLEIGSPDVQLGTQEIDVPQGVHAEVRTLVKHGTMSAVLQVK
mmetsp:Transcript_24676/g.37491  ORF Transcript_24676/g.37491 Transcript_24676/m.37491 type:complete len:111 (-) Transcript_24676:657-989(-)